MKLRLWNFKQWLMFGVMFAVAVVLVWFGDKWYFNYRQYHGRPKSHQVQGQLKFVSQYGLDVMGTHVLDAYPNNSDFAHPQLILVKIAPSTKYSGGLTNAAGLQQGAWIAVKTADNSIGQNTITASEISKATEYSLSGKVVAVTKSVITLSTIRVVVGSSGNYTTSESKQVIVSSNTPVVLLRIKENKVNQTKSSISAIKVGSALSVLTNIPPDSSDQIIPTLIQISQ